jgi:hypothetical protein
MEEAVSLQLLTTYTLVKSKASPCGIYGGQSGTGVDFLCRIIPSVLRTRSFMICYRLCIILAVDCCIEQRN